MNREIKFRAWHNNEMMEFELGESLVDRKEKILDFRSIPVMQFTGLKDKGGKEIYEGDISNDKFVCKYGMTKGVIGFGWFHNDEQFGCKIIQDGIDIVIGNMYQTANP